MANKNDLDLPRLRKQADKILEKKQGIEPPLFGGISPRRVQADKIQGACEDVRIRRDKGVLPNGHRGDAITGWDCTLDIDERNPGGPRRLS